MEEKIMGRLKDKFERRYSPSQSQQIQPQPQNNYYDSPPQEEQRYEEREPERRQNAPLSILDEIKNNPSPKGTFPVVIQGVPVDLHSLEGYMLKVSPYDMRTLQRFEKARLIEEIKNYGRFGGGTKFNMKTILIILLAAGMAVVGIILVMYMPQIMAFFKGGIG